MYESHEMSGVNWLGKKISVGLEPITLHSECTLNGASAQFQPAPTIMSIQAYMRHFFD
jgi:hypothetical protein